MLRKTEPSVFEKLVPVSGDVNECGLGIGDADTVTLRDSVSVVIHSAARVRFDDNLREALGCNVKSVLHVVQFCQTLQHLQVIYYITELHCIIKRLIAHISSGSGARVDDLQQPGEASARGEVVRYYIGSFESVGFRRFDQRRPLVWHPRKV